MDSEEIEMLYPVNLHIEKFGEIYCESQWQEKLSDHSVYVT